MHSCCLRLTVGYIVSSDLQSALLTSLGGPQQEIWTWVLLSIAVHIALWQHKGVFGCEPSLSHAKHLLQLLCYHFSSSTCPEPPHPPNPRFTRSITASCALSTLLVCLSNCRSQLLPLPLTLRVASHTNQLTSAISVHLLQRHMTLLASPRSITALQVSATFCASPWSSSSQAR